MLRGSRQTCYGLVSVIHREHYVVMSSYRQVVTVPQQNMYVNPIVVTQWPTRYATRIILVSLSTVIMNYVSIGATVPLSQKPMRQIPLSVLFTRPSLLPFSLFLPLPFRSLSLSPFHWKSAVSSPSQRTRKRILTHLRVSKRTLWQHLSVVYVECK